MKIKEYTKDGMQERELTAAEEEELAKWDENVKKEKTKAIISAAVDDKAKLNAIINYLGL